MATIFDLSENTAPDGTDRLYITDGTNDEGVQISNLLKGSGAEVPAAKITGTVSHENGGLEADVSAYDGIVQISGGSTSAIKNNWAASAAPTTGDDSGSGYVVGSRWIDTTNDKEYVCLDNSSGAAVWTETTGGGGGGGGVLFTQFAEDANGSASYTNIYSSGTYGNAFVNLTSVNATTGLMVHIPEAMTSIDEAYLFLASYSTTESTITIQCHHLGAGEHIGSGGSVQSTSTSTWYTHAAGNGMCKVDITSLFSNAAAGDMTGVIVEITSYTSVIRCFGCVIEYS